MRQWLAITLVTCTAGACYGGSSLQITPGEVNLGEIWQGQATDVSVNVSNTGSEPLDITAKASCTCINFKLEDKRLQPGQATKMSAQLLPTTPGKFRYLMMVSSGTGQEQSVVISGNARQAYEVTARWARAGQEDGNGKYYDLDALPAAYGDANLQLLFRIRSLRTDDPATKEADEISLESSLFKTLEVKSSAGKDQVRLTEIRAAFTKVPEPGSYTYALKFKTPNGSFSENCGYRILSDVWTEPKQMNLGLINKSATRSENVRINFRSASIKWNVAEIAGTEPAQYADAIKLVKQEYDKESLVVTLEVDVRKLPAAVTDKNGFFNVAVFIRSARQGKEPSTSPGEQPVKLNIYGMVE